MSWQNNVVDMNIGYVNGNVDPRKKKDTIFNVIWDYT